MTRHRSSPYWPQFMLVVMCLSLAAPALAETVHGRVTRVWDGDTVTLNVDGVGVRVRLAGIDAPEHDQPYGDAARDHLSALTLGELARLETDKTDKYGRRVGKLWVRPKDCPRCGLTLDAGLAMLTVGLAWWYRHYADEQSPDDRGRYEFAEYEAKHKGVGLWADEHPTPPWDWPRGDRAGVDPPTGCRIKGNISANGKIYHLPGQRDYDRTRINPSNGERWFCTEAEARAAGWRRARN